MASKPSACADVPSDPAQLRAAFAKVPQSVVAVCGLDSAGVPHGMAASSFTPLSLDPPLVSVAMARSSSTWPVLRGFSRLGISLLNDTQGPSCRRLAAKNGDRFNDVSWTPHHSGAVFLDHAAAHLDCELFDELPGGDHTIALFLIRTIHVDADHEPLVFQGSDFRRMAATIRGEL
jgi:flavin reductase (DIM6/NTAB) family NADH-FMN oxidoreductase RutF